MVMWLYQEKNSWLHGHYDFSNINNQVMLTILSFPLPLTINHTRDWKQSCDPNNEKSVVPCQ